MSAIKSSELRAAVSIQAAIIVSDGRWEQWSDLFLKQLRKVGEFKPGKWSENDDYYLYTFSPKGRGKLADGSYSQGDIQLAFVDSGSGNNYEFSHAVYISKLVSIPVPFAYSDKAPKKFRKGVKVASGNDLVKAIAEDYGLHDLEIKTAGLKFKNQQEFEAFVTDCASALGEGYRVGSISKIPNKGHPQTTQNPWLNFSIIAPFQYAVIEGSVTTENGSTWTLSKVNINGGSARKFIRLDASKITSPATFVKIVSEAIATAPFLKKK